MVCGPAPEASALACGASAISHPPAPPPGAPTTWWPWTAGCMPWGATMAAPASTPSRNTTRGPTSGCLRPACSRGAAAWGWRCWSCSTSRLRPRPRCPCRPPASDPGGTDRLARSLPHALSPTAGQRLPALNRASRLGSPPGTPCAVCPPVRVHSAVSVSVRAVDLCVCLFIQYLWVMSSAAAARSHDCSGSFCLWDQAASWCPAPSLGVDTQGMWVRASSNSADLGGPRGRCRAAGGGRGPSEQVQTPASTLHRPWPQGKTCCGRGGLRGGISWILH